MDTKIPEVGDILFFSSTTEPDNEWILLLDRFENQNDTMAFVALDTTSNYFQGRLGKDPIEVKWSIKGLMKDFERGFLVYCEGAPKPTSSSQKCNCPIRDLLMNGCKCGGI